MRRTKEKIRVEGRNSFQWSLHRLPRDSSGKFAREHFLSPSASMQIHPNLQDPRVKLTGRVSVIPGTKESCASFSRKTSAKNLTFASPASLIVFLLVDEPNLVQSRTPAHHVTLRTLLDLLLGLMEETRTNTRCANYPGLLNGLAVVWRPQPVWV